MSPAAIIQQPASGVSMHRQYTGVYSMLGSDSPLFYPSITTHVSCECGFVIIGVKKPLYAITLPHIPYLYTMIRLAALLCSVPKRDSSESDLGSLEGIKIGSFLKFAQQTVLYFRSLPISLACNLKVPGFRYLVSSKLSNKVMWGQMLSTHAALEKVGVC